MPINKKGRESKLLYGLYGSYKGCGERKLDAEVRIDLKFFKGKFSRKSLLIRF